MLFNFVGGLNPLGKFTQGINHTQFGLGGEGSSPSPGTGGHGIMSPGGITLAPGHGIWEPINMYIRDGVTILWIWTP